MSTHFKPAAACAVAVVIILASTSFVILQMMASPDSPTISLTKPFQPVLHIFSAAGKTLLVAYIAGAWAWITLFALRRSGVHRLVQVSTKPSISGVPR
jgi:hypothetical protein